MAFLTLGVIDSVQGQVNEALRAQLERMYESDQAGRLKMQQIGEEYGFDSDEMKALWEEQTKIDVRNMSRVEEMVQAYGWPGRSLVGDKAANAAFLIVQHADYATQVKYLPLIKAAVEAEALEGQALALLQDRILVAEGKDQIYGTQLRRNEVTGQLELLPIEDEANVDQRRAELGMPPLAAYLKLVRGEGGG